MKQAFIIGVFLFICALSVAGWQTLEENSPVLQEVSASPELMVEAVNREVEISPPPSQIPEPAALYDETLTVRVLLEGQVREMTLGEYLAGVLAAEMPASFEPEALKAQAVAARTNVIRKLTAGSKHDNADVCGDSTCCMGWREPDAPVFAEAVAATDGLAVCYNGTVIDAVFFSTSWGMTEDAVQVWGSEVPYLVSVDSPETAEPETVTVPLTEFCLKIREASPEADFSDDWMGEVEYTQSGAVKTAVIGGVELAGTQLRSIFGLRSACFTLELTASGAVFTTAGYGHGVGLSQYGANELAKEGYDFRDILTWYYSGTEILSLGA